MLMSAPVESTFAALMVLFGLSYTANSILDALIRRAEARNQARATEEASQEV